MPNKQVAISAYNLVNIKVLLLSSRNYEIWDQNFDSYLGGVYDPKESGGQTAKYRHISCVKCPVNNLDTNCVLVTTEIPYSIYEWISFQERGKI